MRERLRRVPDLERALSRLALERGGPRDLAAVRDGLAQARAAAGGCSRASCRRCWRAAREALGGHEALIGLLEAALVAEPPLLARDGGLRGGGVRRGARRDAAAARPGARGDRRAAGGVRAAERGRRAEGQAQQRARLLHRDAGGACRADDGAAARRALRAPADDGGGGPLHHAGAGRDRDADPERRRGMRWRSRRRIFERLRGGGPRARRGRSGRRRRALAEIDVASALADLARGEDWVRPEVGEGRAFRVVGGRHPVVEQALRRTGGSFVANDCELGADGRKRGRSGWSPGRTWRASRRTCGRTR